MELSVGRLTENYQIPQDFLICYPDTTFYELDRAVYAMNFGSLLPPLLV